MQKNLALSTYSFRAGMGGIPRVARLMRFSLEQLHDPEISSNFTSLISEVNNRKHIWKYLNLLRFGIDHRWKAFCSTHFLYDSCQIAQLHFFVSGTKKPALTFIHGIEVWENALPRHINACRQSSMLVSNSNYTRLRAAKCHGDFERAKVCWLATESNSPPKMKLDPPRAPTVLIVSRLDAKEGYKGHDELIESWPMVLKEVPNAILRIVGTGNGRDRLVRNVSEIGCSDSIQFDGFVDESKLESIYLESSVFAMPSRGEGFGIVYIEAMRCGLPIITSTHDAGQEVIKDGETGFAVNLDQKNQLAEKIVYLLQNPAIAAQMGKAGQRRWAENFTLDQFSQRFQPIIEEYIETN